MRKIITNILLLLLSIVAVYIVAQFFFRLKCDFQMSASPFAVVDFPDLTVPDHMKAL